MRKLKYLYRINTLTPKGLRYLLQGFFREGKTMNLLLYFCSKMYPNKVALVQDEVRINYSQLYKKTCNVASNIAAMYDLKHGDRVALMARNSIESAIALFALSRTGVHVFLLNPEMSEDQFIDLCAQRKFTLMVYESAQKARVLKVFPPDQSLVLKDNETESLLFLIDQTPEAILEKRKAGNIVVLTGGTTGKFKSAGRKQSITDFLNPLVALLEKMQLHQYKTVYIPTPIYHGYGLAALTVALLLGKEMYFTHGFDTHEACALIKKNKIEVVTLVPIMLTRMLNENPLALQSLQRVLSGGAALSPGLITTTANHLGPRLYNLYGTTEAGFCVLGTPEDLSNHPTTIGKPIKGVKIRIRSNQEIGMLEVKSKWVMKSRKNRWVETGDLATMDAKNRIYLKGRSDSMIVSGGENVYPKDLEDALSLHESIETAAVIGVPDAEFGSRLKAFVCVKHHQKMSETEVKQWLKSKIARYQMPVSIEFLERMPLTSLGKINKKVLK